MLSDKAINNLFIDMKNIFRSESVEPLFFDSETSAQLKQVSCLFDPQFLLGMDLVKFKDLIKLDQPVNDRLDANKAPSTSVSGSGVSSSDVGSSTVKYEEGRYKKLITVEGGRALLTAKAGLIELRSKDEKWSLEGDHDFYVGNDFAPELFMEIFFETINTDAHYPERESKLLLSSDKHDTISFGMETEFLPGERLDQVLLSPISPIMAINLIIAMLRKDHSDVDNVVSNYHVELESTSSKGGGEEFIVNRFDLSRRRFSLGYSEEECDPLVWHDPRSYVFLGEATLVCYSADKNQVIIFPVDDEGNITGHYKQTRRVSYDCFYFQSEGFNFDEFQKFNQPSKFRLYRDGRLVTDNKVRRLVKNENDILTLSEETCSDAATTACLDADAEAVDCMIRTNLAIIAHFFHFKITTAGCSQDKDGNAGIRDVCKSLLSSDIALPTSYVIDNFKFLRTKLLTLHVENEQKSPVEKSLDESVATKISNFRDFTLIKPGSDIRNKPRRESTPSPIDPEGEAGSDSTKGPFTY